MLRYLLVRSALCRSPRPWHPSSRSLTLAARAAPTRKDSWGHGGGGLLAGIGAISSDYTEMARCGSGHLLGLNSLIKTHQSAAMGHGQCQQIGIGDLARTEDSLPANETLLEQADLLGPEGRAGMAAGLGQTDGHLLGRARIQMPSRSRNLSISSLLTSC